MLPLPIQAQLAQLASQAPPAMTANPGAGPPAVDPYGGATADGIPGDQSMAAPPPAPAAPAPPPPSPGAAEGQGPGPLAFAPQAGAAQALPPLALSGVTAPARTVPAAWVPQHRQTEGVGGTQFSPDTLAALQEATDAGQQVDVDAQKALDEQQRYEHVKAVQEDAQATTDAAEAQKQRFNQDRVMSDQRAKIDSAMLDMQQAQAKGIDTHHWMAEKSTGAKIMMGIGAIAAGWNQGVHGGSNPVLDQINKGIEQDIDAQKTGIEGKEKSFSNASIDVRPTAAEGPRRHAGDRRGENPRAPAARRAAQGRHAHRPECDGQARPEEEHRRESGAHRDAAGRL